MKRKSNKLPIRFVKKGLAARFPDCIEIHKDLKKYPKLYKPILRHELGHTDKTFTLTDLSLDVAQNSVPMGMLIGFMLSRPSTWISLLPFYYDKKRGVVFDINCCIVYAVMIPLIAAVIYFGLKLLG